MTLTKTQLVGAALGVAVVAGVWLLWGKRRMKVARGEAASKRAWVETARASVARNVAAQNRAVSDGATMISKNNPALTFSGSATVLG